MENKLLPNLNLIYLKNNKRFTTAFISFIEKIKAGIKPLKCKHKLLTFEKKIILSRIFNKMYMSRLIGSLLFLHFSFNLETKKIQRAIKHR